MAALPILPPVVSRVIFTLPNGAALGVPEDFHQITAAAPAMRINATASVNPRLCFLTSPRIISVLEIVLTADASTVLV